MGLYVGLDVSLKRTSVCVIDEAGKVVWRGTALTSVEALASVLNKQAPQAERIGLESGSMTPFLWHGLRLQGFAVVCLDARWAKKALSSNPVKTDANDAEGLAQLVRVGWYKEVEVKGMEAHRLRALLTGRQQLVQAKVSLINQVRGLLRPFGLVVQTGSGQSFSARVAELVAGDEVLTMVTETLVAAMADLEKRIEVLDKRLRAQAKGMTEVRRLMSVPGIGPITALAYRAAIDTPTRFAHSRDVGAYLGLTPKRYQSGEVDRDGSISKCGDHMARHLLYEAANVLLTSVSTWSSLKAWGMKLVRKVGPKRARAAVARKLAVILHRMWIEGTDFRHGKQPVAA
ncbi:IS110 family transposase [Rhodospirillum rubrum]|uniref:IS110 family transposase n=1 Tax=Rhodospirillum rubrum TaxID=1085 RepID=UPI0019050BBB|nr:IS110 family transposase [Rhodospirillum rubrum]MBK1665517.1 IS110 family transposase [Rhodospirillum rubrum]MBK1677556.1 IS110 family transposase [Rhodospirillum rubrum]